MMLSKRNYEVKFTKEIDKKDIQSLLIQYRYYYKKFKKTRHKEFSSKMMDIKSKLLKDFGVVIQKRGDINGRKKRRTL